jgi:hypothetical protein
MSGLSFASGVSRAWMWGRSVLGQGAVYPGLGFSGPCFGLGLWRSAELPDGLCLSTESTLKTSCELA